MSGIHLFHMPVNMSQVVLLVLIIFLRLLDDRGDKQRGEGNYYQRYNRHQPVDRKHHYQNAHYGNDGGYDLRKTLIQGHIDGLDVVGNMAQNFTLGPGIEVFQRQTINFFGYFFSEIISYFEGNIGHNIALEVVANKADDI